MRDAHLPEDVLLELVEGDLADADSAAARAHVQDCAVCRATAGELEAARSALRAAPSLDLPVARRAEILRALPEQEGRPSRRRRLALLAPAAAVVVAALAVAVARVSDGEEAAQPPAAELRAAEEQAAADSAAEAAVPPVRRVAGPADDVVRELRRHGLEARVAGDGAVEVGATPAAIRRALAQRPDGAVPVRVR
jgi:anti-sigma factor RsiW